MPGVNRYPDARTLRAFLLLHPECFLSSRTLFDNGLTLAVAKLAIPRLAGKRYDEVDLKQLSIFISENLPLHCQASGQLIPGQPWQPVIVHSLLACERYYRKYRKKPTPCSTICRWLVQDITDFCCSRKKPQGSSKSK